MEKPELNCPCHSASNDGQENPRLLIKKWILSTIFIIIGLLIIRPLMVRQLLSRASAYFQYGLIKEVIREEKKAVWLDRYNDAPWNHLILAYDAVNDQDKLLQTAKKALTFNPKNRPALFHIGLCLAVQGQSSEAIPYLEKVYRLGPETPSELATEMISYYKSSSELLPVLYKKIGRERVQFLHRK